MPDRTGPLAGIKIVEMAGIGPAPHAAMMLADLGATVIRVDRQTASDAGIARPPRFDFVTRGRPAVAIDLKHQDGAACAAALIDRADGLIEGFRPGVMERLGLGPDPCLARNPNLVYGRVTGWGQTGPLSQAAGHDVNYIALTGALDAIGRQGGTPTPPLNLLGDYGGGSILLAFGMLAALLNVTRGGTGQVVDAAIVDGVSILSAALMGLRAAGMHDGPRGENLLDTGAPHYEVYRCADGKFISIAPIERKFRQILLTKLGFDPATFPDPADRKNWDEARRLFVERFAEQPRDFWCALLEGTDACFAPVLTYEEAPNHPHMAARNVFVDIDGTPQPAPAPRFSRTQPATPTAGAPPEGGEEALFREWGIPSDQVSTWMRKGVIGR